ncbi:thioredoxin-like protein [Umbelopsis sp. PMI_123]|nr:thioredoxin-like protein [Umbelopsis sp. PMI_123]
MSAVLYYKPSSVFSSMVRMVIAEKGIKDIEMRLIDLEHLENLSPEYIKINPKGQVPAYVTQDETLTESLDISMYLESHYSSPSLLPGETLARSRVMAQLTSLYDIGYLAINYGVMTQEQAEKDRLTLEAGMNRNKDEVKRQIELHPELREQYEIRIKAYHGKSKDLLDPEFVQSQWAKLGALLDLFEDNLAHGQFLSQENDYSLLDAHATPVLARLVKLGHDQDIQSRPRLADYWRRIQDRDSFKTVYDRPLSLW